MLEAGVGFSLQYPTVAQAPTAAISYVLSLPGATWRLFSVHSKLMLVGLSKLLNALLLVMLAAGVGFSLQYSRWPRRPLQPLAMFYLCPARPGDYLASTSSSC